MDRHDFYRILKDHAEKTNDRYTFKVIDLKVACAEIEDALSNLHKPDVSGSLPMYELEELNEIIKLFNDKEIDLYTCIGRVWNKAYFIGANEGMKAGQLGNAH